MPALGARRAEAVSSSVGAAKPASVCGLSSEDLTAKPDNCLRFSSDLAQLNLTGTAGKPDFLIRRLLPCSLRFTPHRHPVRRRLQRRRLNRSFVTTYKKCNYKLQEKKCRTMQRHIRANRGHNFLYA